MKPNRRRLLVAAATLAAAQATHAQTVLDSADPTLPAGRDGGPNVRRLVDGVLNKLKSPSIRAYLWIRHSASPPCHCWIACVP